MVSPISHVTQSQAAQPASTPRPAQAPAQPPPAPTDTVQLSAAALLQKELTETSAQTASEASHGDVQAKNLLAKEAAGKPPA
jgi:hypothetical protein